MLTATLRFGPRFRTQIASIRNAITEDTNLIKWGNQFYRVCQASGEERAELTLLPREGGYDRSVICRLRLRDLYVTKVGAAKFERYASTLSSWRPEVSILDSAVDTARLGHGPKLFELRSLLVFCVAESLRSDHVATEIDLTIQAATTGVVGRGVYLPIAQLWAHTHQWGQASDAVFRVLSPEARAIALKRRAELSAEERQFSERVRDDRIDPDLRRVARKITTLKRPD